MAIGFPAPTSSGTPAYTITNPNVNTASAADWFGSSVAVSTNYIAVGAMSEDTATNTGTGVVYIFNTSDGSPVQTITNPSYGLTRDNESFGSNVAINDSYLIVQAVGERINTDDNAGAVHVYDTATWTKQYTIANPNSLGAASFDNFGHALAIGTTYFAATSVRDSTNNDYAGTVYVFENSTGNLVYTINNPTPVAMDYFGNSVSISGNYLAIGAHRENSNEGAVYIYDLTTGNQIVRMANPNTIDTSASNDFFGFSVAMNSTHLVVSATSEEGDGRGVGGDPAQVNNAGALYVYNIGSWTTPVYTIRNPNIFGTEDSDQFGRVLAINSNTIIAGTEYEDDASGNSAGAVYTFNLSDGSLINSLTNPNSPNAANERFGRSVAINETNFVIGTLAEFVSGYSLGSSSQTFTFNNRDYIYNSTKSAWEVNSPITVAQSGSPVSDLSELADSTSILNDPANEVLTYADLNAILAVTNPATGQLAFNLDTSDMYIFGGTNWQKVYDEDDVPPPFSFGGDRAIMNIGYSTVESYTGRLDYYDITTASNAQIFGDLTNANSNGKAGFSDSTYGVFAGGIISGGVRSTEIDYITISTTANAQSFGNLTVGRAGVSGCSDGTYGLAAGGDDGAGADSEVIDYVTIATPSNAIDFGDLQNATGRREMGSCSDATYGLWAGGYGSVYYDEVDYVTIQTPANAQSFGNLSSTRSLTAGVSDGTYGLFAGGFTVSGSVIFTNVIEYYTITSPGSATDFGDLSSNKRGHGAAGNATRATFAGGFNNDAGQQITTIEYVTVATPGNVTAFGDLTTNAYQAVGTSGNAA